MTPPFYISSLSHIIVLENFENAPAESCPTMLSFSKTTILVIAAIAVAVVEGFAPMAQPRLSSSTELGAFFFQKPTEKSPTLSVETKPKKASPFSKFGKKPEATAVKEEAPPAKKRFSFGKKDAAPAKTEAKKAPIKKVVAKKEPVKKAVAKKAVAKKAPVKKAAVKKSAPKKAPVKKVVAKKTPVKKPVVKPVAKKPVAKKKLVARKPSKSSFKNDFVVKKPQQKTKLTIYERQCHIN